MGFKDFLKRGAGLDLVAGNELDAGKSTGAGAKQSAKQKKSDSSFSSFGKADEKVLRQLEIEVSRAIEKLEDLRDKLRVRRGF